MAKGREGSKPGKPPTGNPGTKDGKGGTQKGGGGKKGSGTKKGK